MLGRRKVGALSNPYVELRLEELSKCPDRFSRKLAAIAYPESLREIGVSGNGGNEPEMGDSFGEGGELPLLVELVEGRSWDRSFLDCRNALNRGGFGAKFEALSPNDVELRLANFAREVEGAEPLKTEGFSDAKASNGNDSIA